MCEISGYAHEICECDFCLPLEGFFERNCIWPYKTFKSKYEALCADFFVANLGKSGAILISTMLVI